MTDFTFWLRQLPEDTVTHTWYPVGAFADKNVKTGLLTHNKQALLVPLARKPSNPLPDHFLSPEIVHKEGLGDCFQLSWNRFDEIVFEFVDDLLRTKGFIEDPAGCFESKLNVWRDLLDRNGMLQLNKASGLWGELFICSKKQGMESIWTGPSGSDIDFRSDTFAFDVKTSRLKNRVLFNVSGIHQFDFAGDNVFIVWLRIEPGTEKDESIASLLSKIDRELLLPPVKSNLENLINSMPYTLMNDMTFICREIRVFRVKDLPVITGATLKNSFGDNASRIGELTYQIDASGIPSEELQFILDKI